MGLILLIQTFLISLLIGLIRKTFWFSYILFLVFLGGILVIFIYVTALSYNEIFSILRKSFIFIFFILTFLIILFYFRDWFYTNLTINIEITRINDSTSLIEENYIYLLKIYNHSTNFITLFLINYLFLTLVIRVKITNFFYGPLRPSFN